MVVDPKKYYWMRYAAERGTRLPQGGKLTKGDLFGVKEIRGKDEDEVLLIDGTTFRLPINKSELLMNKAKEFKGKTPTITKTAPAKAVKKEQKAVKIVKSPNLPKIAPKAPTNVSKPSKPAEAVKKSGIKIKVGEEKRKPFVAQPVHDEKKGGLVIKLSKLDLPEVDDFTDSDIPTEFRRFGHDSESSTKYFQIALKEDQGKSFWSLSSETGLRIVHQQGNVVLAADDSGKLTADALYSEYVDRLNILGVAEKPVEYGARYE